MSGNASGKSEKRTMSPLPPAIPPGCLNVPNSLVNRSQVTMLKHIPAYCNRECLNLKVMCCCAKTLREEVWWEVGVFRRGMSPRWGSGDKIFVVFKNKFHNLPWLITFYSQSRQGISFAASLCSKTRWGFLEQGNSMGRGWGKLGPVLQKLGEANMWGEARMSSNFPDFFCFPFLFFFSKCWFLTSTIWLLVFFALRFLGRGMWILLKRITRGCLGTEKREKFGKIWIKSGFASTGRESVAASRLWFEKCLEKGPPATSIGFTTEDPLKKCFI